MKLLSIGLNGTTGEIREKLECDCKTLTQEGFRVVIEELDRGGYKFLGLNISDGELSFRNYERIKNVLRGSVSQILADWIISTEENKIINKIVTSNYCYFNHDERAIVESNAVRALRASPATRYDLILARILDYLDNHHELVLDGFLNFRLKDYRLQLSEVIDKVVDDFMMELEYKEFIRVLRYFVDVQEPRVEEAHVVISGIGVFKIYDSHRKILNNQHLESVVLQSHSAGDPNSLNYEDLLISALITIAPHNIMVHSTNRARDEEALETIKSVFDGRVVLCDGCEMCATDYGKSNHTEL
ncbi:putative sporulation protein YtxC [Sporomusa sp.]|uniref:putative sporulation protein YtxC n=1 Tax=Sporomusa sp. TaxID=2078658 RepID=UPI002BD649AC|nr:putative sporulation protein YtxC [Sporomusa sp.]HWR43864.1 putative sporulation protein YtxC [Sporomusa sp.]